MKRTLGISVSKSPKEHGVVTCQTVPSREKPLRSFLGSKAKLMVVLPGDSIEELAIREIPEGGVV